MKPEFILTVDSAAIYLHRSTSWIYRSIKSGRIAAARVGNGWRIPASEILRLLRPANAAAVANFKRTQLCEEIDRHEQEFEHDLKRRSTETGQHR